MNLNDYYDGVIIGGGLAGLCAGACIAMWRPILSKELLLLRVYLPGLSSSFTGTMGWYAFVPAMECYHGVLSFDHLLEGGLELNGQYIDYTGGRGYIEKD
jgi:succinate dehydrogenase/fumarate reductase flavoprotein subunit